MRTPWLLLVGLLLAGCGSGGQAPRAVHAPLCYPTTRAHAPACRSPDGAWEIRPGFGHLALTRISTGATPVDYSSNGCCDDIAWVYPHRLFFAADYSVFMLDPPSPRASFIANFSDFYVSPDGRWLAGYAAGPSQTIGLISLATDKCVIVPGDYVGSETRELGNPRTGFSPSGDAVVVARAGRAVAYRISELSRACPWMTQKP